MLTIEFIVWSNCANNCQFCWQRLLDDQTTRLDSEHKVKCLENCRRILDSEGQNCDVLVVGGEAYSDQGEAVNAQLKKVFNKIADKVRKGDIRYFYANTSLTYENKVNLIALFEAFKGIEDHLKFTTSYDLAGRFDRDTNKSVANSDSSGACHTENKEALVRKNLEFIYKNYPDVNIVVNTIITNAVYKAIFPKDGSEPYNPFWFMGEYPNTVVWVNLIPYIPIKGDNSLDAKFSETVKVLEKANSIIPGYFKRYVEEFDISQDKRLYEYHSDKGFIENTAPDMPCGHNKNFSLVNRDGGCYICKLKDYYINNRSRL